MIAYMRNLPFYALSSLIFGGAKREGTAAVVVGAGLVVDARTLLLVLYYHTPFTC